MIDPAILCKSLFRSTDGTRLRAHFLMPSHGPVSSSGSRALTPDSPGAYFIGTGLLSAGLDIVRALVHLQLPVYKHPRFVLS